MEVFQTGLDKPLEKIFSEKEGKCQANINNIKITVQYHIFTQNFPRTKKCYLIEELTVSERKDNDEAEEHESQKEQQGNYR